MSTAIIVISGCSGGDVNIEVPTPQVVGTVPPVVTTPDGGDSNPCASYTDAGTTYQGTEEGSNCVYSSSFVGENNPLLVDLTIPAIDGVHIFEDTLQVGRDVDYGAIETGPTLTIAAGNTLAFQDSEDYLLIHRGAKIIANGRVDDPITFTGVADAVDGTAGPFDTQLWGGVVINGRGITNKCDDEQRDTNTCHIAAEGKPTHYGGNDNADNSGELNYIVIKHPGFEVAPGDELNGLTLNAVGSGTTIANVQVYSTFDDGVEFFGGAVEVRNFVALYVRDDSIDYADGWVGSVTNALVIHQEDDGNRCIEADNQGSVFGARPLTNARIRHMTCITSGSDESAGGTHGDSEGIILRRGVASQILDSIIYDGYARNELSNSGNECLELDDSETRDLAQRGVSVIRSTLIACQEATKDSLNNGDTVEQWVLNSGTGSYDGNRDNRIVKATDDADVAILGGTKGFFTLDSFTDADGNSFSVTSTDGQPIGAVTADNDWTEGWTVCLHESASAGGCGLWFVN